MGLGPSMGPGPGMGLGLSMGPRPGMGPSMGLGPGQGPGQGLGPGQGPGPPMGLGLPPGLTPPPGMGPKNMTPLPMMTPIRPDPRDRNDMEDIQRFRRPSSPLPIQAATDTLGAVVSKKVVGTYRYTRGQEGILLLALNNGKSANSLRNVSRHIIAGSNKDDAVFDTEGAVVRPGGAMVVIWQVPEAMYMDKENVNLSIGLTR